MIKYQLLCQRDHAFEGWFRSSDDFTVQSAGGQVACPACGSGETRKAIMAPSIARRAGGAPAETARIAEIRGQIGEAMSRARAYVEKNFDYVGERFPEEARRIHYGETKERGIFGEATGREVRDLSEEGVTIAPLPPPATDAAAFKKKLN